MKFETERLLIRNLQDSDFVPFHNMHSNPNVMKYTGDDVKTVEEDTSSLAQLITNYTDPNNEFWV